ncbi:NAD(P)H-dependent glycerol-3-phosphate dehydrogenase, partial [Mycoplasmopsis synoviae]
KYTLYNGGKLETLLGLTGIGDLIVTAFSIYSRNFNFWYYFGKNGNKAFETSMTVERLIALKNIYENVVSKKVIELPIIEALYTVVYKNRNFYKMLSKLLTRELK